MGWDAGWNVAKATRGGKVLMAFSGLNFLSVRWGGDVRDPIPGPIMTELSGSVFFGALVQGQLGRSLEVV